MKRCPNCAQENAQTNMYCERCGTPLAASPANPDQTYASVNEAYTTPSERSFTTQEHTTQDQPYYTPAPPPPPVYPTPQASTNTPPPPPIYYTPPPVSPAYYNTPSPAVNYGYDGPVQRTRSFGAALLSAILFLIGGFSFAFGVAGFILYGTTSTVVGFVFIALSIVVLIALVILLIVRKQLVLKWWVRVLVILGMTIAAIVALFASAALNHGGSNYTSFGIVFIIYGFATASAAFW